MHISCNFRSFWTGANIIALNGILLFLHVLKLEMQHYILLKQYPDNKIMDAIFY